MAVEAKNNAESNESNDDANLKEVRFSDDIEVHYVPSRTLWQKTKTNIKYSPQQIKRKAKSIKDSVSDSYHVMVELLT
ncbi:Hypothetical predicted protein [Paramuricea clavata]|nr:Hypothetical predicted protein [Paramuricea clavata]